MLTVYVDEIAERCLYTFDYVLKDYGISYLLTNDIQAFNQSNTVKLNYSERIIDNVVQLPPASLLFEETMREHRVANGQFQDEPCLVIDGRCDPFAAIFFVLSRMEEYTSTALPDIHDRFRPENSILFKNGWLNKVVCERWTVAIHAFLKENDLLDALPKQQKVRVIPTFDIDNAYAYKLKEGSRKMLSVMKDYSKRDKRRLSERKAVLSGNLKDPYDTYAIIRSISERGFPVHLFWLLGDYARFDKNISYSDPTHRKLIQAMADHCTVGIHPSYRSHLSHEKLHSEIGRLETILNAPVRHSRQHFLKMHLPETYRNLEKAGVEHDYTMGYASETGFRAGTARAHKWFDLSKNYCTNLIIHPFSYMDGTLLEYKNWSIDRAKTEIQQLFQEVARYGGDFIFLWHNETIGDYGKWNGWSDVLEFTLQLQNPSPHE